MHPNFSSPTRIEPATPADLDTVHGLIRDYFAYDHIPFDAEAVRAGLARLIGEPTLGWALVMRDADRGIAGYAIVSLGVDLEFGGRTATVTDLYFRPERRRMGLGMTMLRHIEARCLAEGIAAMELLVERDNHEAQGLYAKFGFTPHDRIPMSKRLVGKESASST